MRGVCNVSRGEPTVRKRDLLDTTTSREYQLQERSPARVFAMDESGKLIAIIGDEVLRFGSAFAFLSVFLFFTYCALQQ